MLWPTKGTGLLHVANNNKLKKAKIRKKNIKAKFAFRKVQIGT